MKIKFYSQTGGKLIKKERQEYLTLCKQLTSRTELKINYFYLTSQLLDYLRMYAIQKIEALDYKKEKMKIDLEYIFKNIDRNETNYIGKLNIVSLQIIILFTENCYPPEKEFTSNYNNAYDDYKQLRKGDWKQYNVIKTNLIKNYGFKILYLDSTGKPYTTSTNPNEQIFLITILDYLSIDEINTSFLDNLIICGVSSTFIYADGRYITPFEFLEHDITHGNNYKSLCYDTYFHSKEEIISFYNYCKNTISDKKNLDSIKFMVFLLIHESYCDFFPNQIDNSESSKVSLINSILEYKILNTNFLNMKRYLNNEDLNLSIPKEYRTDNEKITKYLSISTERYVDALINWRKSINNPDNNIIGVSNGFNSSRRTSPIVNNNVISNGSNTTRKVSNSSNTTRKVSNSSNTTRKSIPVNNNVISNSSNATKKLTPVNNNVISNGSKIRKIIKRRIQKTKTSPS